jgi:hypothetical protein
MIGLFMEIGPCLVNENGNDTRINPSSWNTQANMIFLDQVSGAYIIVKYMKSVNIANLMFTCNAVDDHKHSPYRSATPMATVLPPPMMLPKMSTPFYNYSMKHSRNSRIMTFTYLVSPMVDTICQPLAMKFVVEIMTHLMINTE